MHNPWLDVPKVQPYILPDDSLQIMRFNRDAGEDKRIQTRVLPDPYLGDMNAPIMLLGLHGGFHPDDEKVHRERSFQAACRANLAHQVLDYPFYILQPQYAATPGYRWWYDRLQALINECGLENVIRKIAAIQYFPYHCKEYGLKELLPSQAYGFHLVEKALARNALIIMMAGKKHWEEQILALKNYPHLYGLSSTRNYYITSENCKKGYPKIIEALGG